MQHIRNAKKIKEVIIDGLGRGGEGVLFMKNQGQGAHKLKDPYLGLWLCVDRPLSLIV